jgi:hypothetical protein
MGTFSKIISPDINKYLPRIAGKMKKVGNMASNYTTKLQQLFSLSIPSYTQNCWAACTNGEHVNHIVRSFGWYLLNGGGEGKQKYLELRT